MRVWHREGLEEGLPLSLSCLTMGSNTYLVLLSARHWGIEISKEGIGRPGELTDLGGSGPYTHSSRMGPEPEGQQDRN